MDGDSDFEVLGGTMNSLSVFDIKDIGNNSVAWNMFRGNNKRNGYFAGGFECSVSFGDVNGDTIVNILDLVQISNYILELQTPTYPCAADLNEDGVVNILDLVLTANYILEN
jgi:hypothetical protein